MNSSTTRFNVPLNIIALAALGAILVQLKAILVPLAVAFFLVMIWGPSVVFMKRRGTPKAFTILIIILVTALTVFLTARIFYTQVPGLIEDYPRYLATLQKLYHDLAEELPPKARELIDFDWVGMLPSGASSLASALGELIGVLKSLLVILFFMVFLLLEREQYLYRIKLAYRPEEQERVLEMIKKVHSQTESYIVGKTLISAATGLAVTFFLWIMGVKYFFVWGLLTFLLNFIPYLGSIIATALPLLTAMAQMATSAEDQDFALWKILLLLGGLTTIQLLVGSLLEPRFLGQRLRLSPFVVFLSFMVWGWLWGLPGMILSVPVTATVKIVFENMETMKPLALLMSNRSEGGKA